LTKLQLGIDSAVTALPPPKKRLEYKRTFKMKIGILKIYRKEGGAPKKVV
jgi:hypothetical protein